MQPSLGGNAKTVIICAITPALCHVEESHSTLRFACRAKRVVNNAVVNEVGRSVDLFGCVQLVHVSMPASLTRTTYSIGPQLCLTTSVSHLQVLSDAAVLKRQAHEIEELKQRLAASGWAHWPSDAKSAAFMLPALCM